MRNNTALTNFFEDNRKKLFFYLLKLSGNHHDAEDIFQDTFIKYAVKYPENISVPFLFTVAKNLYTDALRGRKNQQDIEDTELSTDNNPEKLIIESRGENRIMAALSRLNQDERDLLAMAGQDGLSYAEISRITKMTESNVKVKIFRARKKLKEILEGTNE